MFEFPIIFLAARNADGDNVGIACVVKNRVGIVDCAVYCIGVDILIVGLVFLRFLLANVSFAVQFDELILVPFYSINIG